MPKAQVKTKTLFHGEVCKAFKSAIRAKPDSFANWDYEIPMSITQVGILPVKNRRQICDLGQDKAEERYCLTIRAFEDGIPPRTLFIRISFCPFCGKKLE